MNALIGRDRELRTLDQALQNARQNLGSFWLLSGEAGIGKTRLVDELKRQAASQDFAIFQGNCFEQDAALPYAPWTDGLRAAFGPLSAPEIRQRLGPLASEFVRLLPELRLLLPDVPPSPPLEAAAEKYRSFESLTRFLVPPEAARPSLIVLEDLHWSDSLSLELMHFLARRISHLPVLLIGTCRTGESAPYLDKWLSVLDREHLVSELPLQLLNRHELLQMVQAVLGSERHIPAAVPETLLARTDGNPLFVEEVLKDAVGAGGVKDLLAQAGGDEATVPLALQRMLQQRAALLPAAAQRILLHASVIGQRFDFGLLQEITGVSEPELLQALKTLLTAQWIRQESADQYAFAHALTRDAVRTLMLLREQGSLHQKIGENLERSQSSGADTRVGEMAYHFFLAGVWEKAARYGQRAGDVAHGLHAPREALAFYSQSIGAAVQLGIEPSRQSLRGRARAFELLGEFDSAAKDYEAALESASRAGDRSAQCESLLDLGLLWQSRDIRLAGEYFQRALSLARDLGETALLVRTLNRMGNWSMNCGQLREAISFHQEALDLSHRLGDRRGTAETMDLLGLVSYGQGDVVRGAEFLQAAIPVLRELDDRQGLVNTLTNLTLRARLDTEVLGDIDFAELTTASDEALQIATGSGWPEGEALALMQGAISLQHEGEYGRALERLDRARSIVQESGNREARARTHLIRGEILVDLLAFTEAAGHFESALTLVRELGSGLLTRAATGHLALVAVSQNDFARASMLLNDLLPSEYPESGESFPRRAAWSVRVQQELAEGQPARALDIIERLLGTTPNLDRYGPQAVPRLSRLRASALAAVGRMQEAENELHGALEIAHQRKEPPMLWRLHADLGALYRVLRRREEAGREFAAARSIVQELANNVPDGPLRDNFIQQALGLIPAAPTLTPRQLAKQESSGLTAREREVALLIARAKSNREIADELVISEKTAERHVANILLKLGFSSRTQIAVWAAEKGLRD